jgi:hypothetical protein
MDRLPTHDDANLILRIYELRREPKMREARAWFAANFYPQSFAEFQSLCPPGSETNAYARMVTSYWEMVASFVASGVLSDELFFQSGMELMLTWIRARPIVEEMRKVMGSPRSWRNLELVAGRYVEYLNANSPGAYEAFAARMGTRPAQQASQGN